MTGASGHFSATGRTLEAATSAHSSHTVCALYSTDVLALMTTLTHLRESFHAITRYVIPMHKFVVLQTRLHLEHNEQLRSWKMKTSFIPQNPLLNLSPVKRLININNSIFVISKLYTYSL